MPRQRLAPVEISSGPFFSPGIRVDRLVFVSGQTARDEAGRIVGEGDCEQQARQVLDRLKAVLREGDAALADVVKLTTYLVDPDDYPAFNRVRSEYFPTEPPASSTVVVKQLLSPELLIEVDAIAVLRSTDAAHGD